MKQLIQSYIAKQLRVKSNEIKTCKDLKVWQEAMKLAKEVYKLTGGFPKEAVLRKAMLSVEC